MQRQRILPLFFLLIAVCGIILWKDNKREVETGKTAYIDWDRLPENRSFVWLEKENFEEYMETTAPKKEEERHFVLTEGERYVY